MSAWRKIQLIDGRWMMVNFDHVDLIRPTFIEEGGGPHILGIGLGRSMALTFIHGDVDDFSDLL